MASMKVGYFNKGLDVKTTWLLFLWKYSVCG